MLKSLLVSVVCSDVVCGVSGGAVTAAAFSKTTGVKKPLVLGTMFLVGASMALGSVKDDSKVSKGDRGTD